MVSGGDNKQASSTYMMIVVFGEASQTSLYDAATLSHIPRDATEFKHYLNR